VQTEVTRFPKVFSSARRAENLWNFILYSRVLWAWLFLVPTLITLLVVAGKPLFGTFYFSFTGAKLLSLDENTTWVGFQNYYRVLSDPDWWTAVKNTVGFTVISVSLETFFGLIVALILNQSFKGKGWLRAAVLVPWAIPTVISAKMWTWMLNDLYGVINQILIVTGIIHSPIAWLAGTHTSMISIVFVDVWKTTPFMALLLLAGLQLIPKEVEEAASLDSNSKVKTFFSITLPLLKPTLAIAVIFRSLDALRIFDLVYVLTGNRNETATMTVYARQRLMEFQEFGTGSAASVLIFCFISVITLIYLWAIRPTKREA
jgi:trehalose/maltose transport system permease protein